ncbi:MAG: GNAT family N-acetyltransferase, partial [Proteobacteria bacterium]|nr:GNAT family N-acetyltransferase [Pseudomonadota bacterium]
MSYRIRSTESRDYDAVAAQICYHWTLTKLGYIDTLVETFGLPGFVAVDGGDKVIGSLTWRSFENCFQVMTLISDQSGLGIGSELLTAAEEEARRLNFSRLLISTENSYTDALVFYQKRGYVLYRVHFNVMENLRKLKPSIPEIDTNGIPIRDQIDLIKDLPGVVSSERWRPLS